MTSSESVVTNIPSSNGDDSVNRKDLHRISGNDCTAECENIPINRGIDADVPVDQRDKCDVVENAKSDSELASSRNASERDLEAFGPQTDCSLFTSDDVAEDTGVTDDMQASTSQRPKYEHQSSNIAEIFEQSGSFVSDEEITTSAISDDEMAIRAWKLTRVGSTPTIEEADDEFVATRYLRQRLKHVFILSTAGKPIYSRYGNEGELSSLTGVIQALVSFTCRDGNDELLSIKSGHWTCVFLHRPPLILVVASRTSDSYPQLKKLLLAVHHQMFSLFTPVQLNKIFENRNNFDLRRFLTGSEHFFRSLINSTETGPSLFLNAVKVHPMNPSVRTAVGQAVAHYAKERRNQVVFAFVVANNQLVTVARMKRYPLHPLDSLLIINLVAADSSFKNAEFWVPVCLPKFDKTGFLHAHISYLSEDCRACLLLLSVDRAKFHALSDVRKKIVEKLRENKTLPLLADAIRDRHSFGLDEAGVSDLWHFLYKSPSGQFTCPALGVPYTEPEAQERLFSVYLKLHHRMHTNGESLSIMFASDSSEAVLGWVDPTFELYAVFSPLTSKAAAVAKVDKLKNWLKTEQRQLFILNPPLY